MQDFDAKSSAVEKPANILVVDDREDDVILLRRAFQSVDVPHNFAHVGDGDEAIKYLSREAPYDNAALYPVPDVVVLDLKMPRKNGFEVLQWLRDQNKIKPSPVVILTSSNREDDKQKAKELGAGSYYAKPADFAKLVGVAKDINRRWLHRRRSLKLLVVDDDETDRMLIKRAFEKLNVGYEIECLKNGDEALAFLKGEGIYGDRHKHPFPNFILTDLKMPGADGFDILSFLKEHPAILIVPVVMLSGSDDPHDVRQAYLLGASSFIVKPAGMDALEGIVLKLHYYWSECEVPEVDEHGHAVAVEAHGKLGERFQR